ncbi:adenosylcobinamide-phosphate synthase CbiB [Viridibacillus sp. NPDC093762]|uniref:adenosylcobinamide-phosphate synthase CbiB n=1 Tax=Viridibacillus sp. NPDC093762 TaxID=3390720 RepID=UPI003D044068
MLSHIIACTIGIALDWIIGDPPKMPHPVRWVGTLIAKLTELLNKGKHRKVKGLLLVLIVVVLTTASTFAVIYFAYSINVILGIFVESILIAIGLAGKSLKQAALEVYNPLVSGDLQQARVKLSWIVGRDTDHLSVPEVTRGVVETVSENTSDGVTAPLFWAFLFGGAGLWMYKAVNTLDSMVAYKNERFADFGYVAAHVDDVLNYVPSRMTGLLLMIGTKNESGKPFAYRMKGWLRDAKKHPSPNSGWLEAATAYQLGIQLGGVNSYRGIISNRAKMGEVHFELGPQHIIHSIKQMQIVTILFWLLMVILGGIFVVIT